MHERLYRDLATWYRLLDPVEDHRDEADEYAAALEHQASRLPRTLLELGAGAGHNAFHLKRRFRCTLTDLSPEMLDLSREINPECEHVLGDMRSLRLGRTFDADLAHDAVAYMTSEADLLDVARTAFEHTRPGGAAVFAPDCLRETFREEVDTIAGDDGERSLRCLEWRWDPDPADSTYVVDYALLMRERGQLRTIHDRHTCGLFAREEWLRALQAVGYRAHAFLLPLAGGGVAELFSCGKE